MTRIMRHFSINRILFLVVLLVTYMSRNVQGRLTGEGLVGGVETSLYEIPYLVSISTFGLHLCGGTIINEQFILAAAHCVIDFDNEFWTLPLTIVAGVNDLEDENLKSRVKVAVDTVYVPATYNGSSKISNDDIAVLKLQKKLNLAHNVALNTLELPSSTEGKRLTENNSYEKTEALVVGFGWNKVWLENVTIEGQIKKVEDGDSDGKMLKAKAWIQPNFQCQTFYIWLINDSQICANIIQHPSDVPQGVCSGDSGGPLVVENTVVGIVSYNKKGCDDRKQPAVYTRVSAYIDFINKAMKNITDDTMRFKSW